MEECGYTMPYKGQVHKWLVTDSRKASKQRGGLLINKKWTKYWGIIPFAFFLVLQLSVSVIESLTESSLRSVPKMILFWFAILSAFALVFWAGSNLLKWKKIKQFRCFAILKNVFVALFISLIIGTMCLGMFISAFLYEPEHIVERNGTRMVASVNSFLQEMVYYYEYKNVLFHGAKQIGWEDYGNGGGDPLVDGIEPNRWFFEGADENNVMGDN